CRPGDKKSLVFAVGMKKARAKRFVDLVGRLGDAGADRSMDMVAPRAELLHRFDRRVGDSGKGSTPTGGGRSHHHGLVVGKQHRRAIGGQDSEQEVGPVGDDPVGARPPVLRPRFIGDNYIGRMNLVDRRELGLGQDGGDGEASIAGNRLAIVIAAIADVEPRAFTDRNSAAASEESMRELAKADRPDDFHAAHSIFRMMMSSSAWLPTMNS